jgi:hypothetical protein
MIAPRLEDRIHRGEQPRLARLVWINRQLMITGVHGSRLALRLAGMTAVGGNSAANSMIFNRLKEKYGLKATVAVQKRNQ